MKDLQTCRQEIDEIDAKLTDLFTQRMKIAEEVAAYKQAKGLPVLDSKREKEKLDKIAKNAEDERSGRELCELFSKIMELSRNRQAEILKK